MKSNAEHQWLALRSKAINLRIPIRAMGSERKGTVANNKETPLVKKYDSIDLFYAP